MTRKDLKAAKTQSLVRILLRVFAPFASLREITLIALEALHVANRQLLVICARNLCCDFGVSSESDLNFRHGFAAGCEAVATPRRSVAYHFGLCPSDE